MRSIEEIREGCKGATSEFFRIHQDMLACLSLAQTHGAGNIQIPTEQIVDWFNVIEKFWPWGDQKLLLAEIGRLEGLVDDFDWKMDDQYEYERILDFGLETNKLLRAKVDLLEEQLQEAADSAIVILRESGKLEAERDAAVADLEKLMGQADYLGTCWACKRFAPGKCYNCCTDENGQCEGAEWRGVQPEGGRRHESDFTS